MSELSPRQRMINMMYLVLTALLALNISKEVLDAFQKMDDSIDYSFSEKYEDNLEEYADLKNRADNNPIKFDKWNDLAKNVREESEILIQVIEKVRSKIDSLAVRDTDPDSKTFEELKKKDDKEITIKVLIKPVESNGYGLGLDLKTALNRYRESLLKLQAIDFDNDGEPDENIFAGSDSVFVTSPLKPGRGTIHELFNTDNYKKDESSTKEKSWEHKFYGHVPVAAMAFMNQMKMDIVNMEGSILELLQKKTGQSSITVNAQRGVVLAPRQTIMLGDSFHARVFVAGVDTNQLPKFNLYAYNAQGNKISDDVIDSLLVDGSQGVFSVKPKRQGTYWLGGDIVVQTESGPEKYKFKQQYRVEKPMSVISPDKMNVIWTQVQNPVSISVPGYSSDELRLYSNVPGCKITKVKNGTYNVLIPDKRKKLPKNLKNDDGVYVMNLYIKANGKLVGKKIKFRIKDVPPPKPSIRRQIGGSGSMAKSDLLGATVIRAKQVDFDFELSFEITSFDFSYQTSTGEFITNNYIGNKFTDIKKQFQGLRVGDKVIFDNIEYKIKGSKNAPDLMVGENLIITIK